MATEICLAFHSVRCSVPFKAFTFFVRCLVNNEDPHFIKIDLWKPQKDDTIKNLALA